MTPKVSIIVPVYNVEKYLSRCMDSLLNQTLKDIEIILVDDESPDNCPAMCDKYALQDNRVKVVHKKNQGLGFARNSGLEISTGEYVAFVDSDDYVDVNMYETLYNFAKDNDNADSVSCGLRLQTGANRYINVVDCMQPVVYENKQEISEVILDMIASEPNYVKERKRELSACTSIFKTQIINKYNIRFTSEREYGSEDFLFKVDFWKFSTLIVFVPDIFYHYCLNTSSLTQTFQPEKYVRYKKLYELLYNKTKDFDKDKLRVNRFFIGYVRAHIFNLMISKLSKREKKQALKEICNDQIWGKIKFEYTSKKLPLIPRLIYISICRNWINLLYIITWFGGGLKKRIKR